MRTRTVAMALAAGLMAAACSSGHRTGPRTTTTSTSDSTITTTTEAPTTASTGVPVDASTTTSHPATTATTAARRPAAATSTTARKPVTTETPAAKPPETATSQSSGPTIGPCPFFPADNPWNQDVRGLPVDPKSDTYVASISAGGKRFLHADFGGGGAYGIPYVVTSTAPAVPITYDAYGDESDPGPFPIPLDAPVEDGSDGHVLAVDTRSCTLFELYQGRRSGSGWVAASGAKFDLRSNKLRPETWTSADAAGLPILAGLVRFDEVAAGEIRHALRFTVDRTQNGYIHPATHQAGDSNASLPPMGLRLRLKSTFDLSPFHGQARVVLTALQRYGMIVADNGGSWFISGASDKRWDDDDLNQLKTVPGSAFETVQTGTIH